MGVTDFVSEIRRVENSYTLTLKDWHNNFSMVSGDFAKNTEESTEPTYVVIFCISGSVANLFYHNLTLREAFRPVVQLNEELKSAKLDCASNL